MALFSGTDFEANVIAGAIGATACLFFVSQLAATRKEAKGYAVFRRLVELSRARTRAHTRSRANEGASKEAKDHRGVFSRHSHRFVDR